MVSIKLWRTFGFYEHSDELLGLNSGLNHSVNTPAQEIYVQFNILKWPLSCEWGLARVEVLGAVG
jgi:hypothetical protein